MVRIMKTLSTLASMFVLFAILFGSAADAQSLQSRFLPDRVYNIAITKTLSGNDGMQDVSPITSTQRMRIETRARSGDAIPVTLEVYSTIQQSRGNEEQLQWEFSFDAHDDGSLSDVRIISAAEPFPADLAHAVLSRQLAPVLFETAYALKTRNENRVIVGRQTPRDGAEEFVDIEYTVDRSLSEAEEGASREPMATEDSGTALFNTDDQFFTERVLHEVNRIYVAPDETGEEKNVVMRKDITITVDIDQR